MTDLRTVVTELALVFLMNITILVGKLKKGEEKKVLFGEEKMLLNLKLGPNL